jgi:hypothetical protein
MKWVKIFGFALLNTILGVILLYTLAWLSSLYTSLLDTLSIPKSTTDTRNKRISLMDSQRGAYYFKYIKINYLKTYV